MTSTKKSGATPTQSSGSALPRNPGVKPGDAKCQTGSRSARNTKSRVENPKAKRGQDQQPGGKPGWQQAQSKKFQNNLVAKLMEQVAVLNLQVKTLTAKLDATTKPGVAGKPTTPSGVRPCTIRRACSQPLIRNAGVKKPGRTVSVVGTVTTGARAGDSSSSSNIPPTGTPKRKLSTVSLVTVRPTQTSGPSSTSDVPRKTQPTESDTPKVEKPATPSLPVVPEGDETGSGTDVSPVAICKMARELPALGGASYAATLAAGPVKEIDKPVFALSAGKTVNVKPIQKLRKQALRDRVALVKTIDDDCYYYLLSEFAFLERKPDTMRAMQQKLSKYLAKYDQAALTAEERYRLIIGTVAHAMAIPDAEQTVRAMMKNDVILEEIGKHNKFVNDGVAGNVRSGFFGIRRAKVLPAGTKTT